MSRKQFTEAAKFALYLLITLVCIYATEAWPMVARFFLGNDRLRNFLGPYSPDHPWGLVWHYVGIMLPLAMVSWWVVGISARVLHPKR